MEDLKKYLLDFASLKNDELNLVVEQLQIETIKKGTYFLNYNQVSRKIGWVQGGVFRYIYIAENGTEHTKYFVNEKQFLSAIESFNTQTASAEAIEALTDATIYTLTYERYQKLFDLIPAWGKLVTAITNYSFNQKVKELSPMVVQDAKTRYENFLRIQPNVIQRVPLGLIANYLGMTKQSLSRLRRELALG
jgi:CRP-like cAMP-binding protein